MGKKANGKTKKETKQTFFSFKFFFFLKQVFSFFLPFFLMEHGWGGRVRRSFFGGSTHGHASLLKKHSCFLAFWEKKGGQTCGEWGVERETKKFFQQPRGRAEKNPLSLHCSVFLIGGKKKSCAQALCWRAGRGSEIKHSLFFPAFS